MKTAMTAVLTAMGAAFTLAGAGAAQEPMRQLGVHVHGQARLSVAMDSSGLVFAELESPAFNLYGFEGAARTDAQRETVQAVAAALNTGALIAYPDRAGCALVEHRLGDGQAPHAHDHDAHDDAEAGATGHGGYSHDGHGHNAPDDPDHADVTVSWTYQCDRAQAADRFDVQGLFDALPRLERVEAEAFDGRRAAVRTLTPGAAGLVLE